MKRAGDNLRPDSCHGGRREGGILPEKSFRLETTANLWSRQFYYANFRRPGIDCRNLLRSFASLISFFFSSFLFLFHFYLGFSLFLSLRFAWPSLRTLTRVTTPTQHGSRQSTAPMRLPCSRMSSQDELRLILDNVVDLHDKSWKYITDIDLRYPRPKMVSKLLASSFSKICIIWRDGKLNWSLRKINIWFTSFSDTSLSDH